MAPVAGVVVAIAFVALDAPAVSAAVAVEGVLTAGLDVADFVVASMGSEEFATVFVALAAPGSL